MARASAQNSISSTVEIISAAHKEIEPPANVDLAENDLPFFHHAIEEFARSQWSQHQLEIAAMMARCMADLSSEQQALRHEGYLVSNPNGSTTENPRLRAVKSLIADLLAFRRSLGVNARAKSEAHVAHKKTAIAKQIEDDAVLNCDLIAKPIY